METRKQTFALYFGNRGFFPERLVAGARAEMTRRLDQLGYGSILLDAGATRFGAVESPQEGEIYAKFLEQNRGKFDGAIICLPNFGDETGAIAAMKHAGVPILVHAYPDKPGEMDFQSRRDAFCGKLSIMDVFRQYGVPYTNFTPHVVWPASDKFAEHIRDFAAVCRVVNGMKEMVVGAVGARTSAFKTVRFDELTLQSHGITTETFDMSEIFRRMKEVDNKSDTYRHVEDRLRKFTTWEGVPDDAYEKLVRLTVALKQITAEYKLNALALRCWIELQTVIGIAPCVVIGFLNDEGITTACEMDVCNAISMHALSLASQRAATCLDWNNNYGEDLDKCILFHCGPVPQSLMTGPGKVIDHPMFAKALGSGCGFGCNIGRIASAPITFASSKTENGRLVFYMGEGEFTKDPIEEDFFGCGGVAHIPDLQKWLKLVGKEGFRHHVSVTTSHVGAAVREAFETYLKYEFVNP